MLFKNGIEKEVSVYACVRVLEREYSSFEQVYLEPFFLPNICSNELYPMFYNIIRRNPWSKDDVNRIERIKNSSSQCFRS